MGARRNFSRREQRRHLAYTFQAADDAMQMDFNKTLHLFYQACSQVLRFGGQNSFLGDKDFCFYYYIYLKQILLRTTQFRGPQKYLGWHCPRMPPRGYWPAFYTKTMPYVTATVTKMRFFGSNSQVY